MTAFLVVSAALIVGFYIWAFWMVWTDPHEDGRLICYGCEHCNGRKKQ